LYCFSIETVRWWIKTGALDGDHGLKKFKRQWRIHRPTFEKKFIQQKDGRILISGSPPHASPPTNGDRQSIRAGDQRVVRIMGEPRIKSQKFSNRVN
jgi:hypothetical protein